jgi:hypothetical protein
MGDEAVKRYKEGWEIFGFGSFFSCCLRDKRASGAEGRRGRWSQSLGSRARLVFGSKHSESLGSL